MQSLTDGLLAEIDEAKREAEQELAEQKGINGDSCGFCEPEVKSEVTPPPPPPAAPVPKQEPVVAPRPTKPLIYFNYPVQGFEDLPAWTRPLREALMQAGYAVYLSEVAVSGQFAATDIPMLNALPKRLVPSVCRSLRLPEELTMAFDYPAVTNQMRNGDTGRDSEAAVFKELWFLSRSSIMISDLVRDPRGVGFGQKMLFSRFFDLPVIGISPVGGVLNPWVQRSVSVLFTDAFNVANIMPLIRGYAPLL